MTLLSFLGSSLCNPGNGSVRCNSIDRITEICSVLEKGKEKRKRLKSVNRNFNCNGVYMENLEREREREFKNSTQRLRYIIVSEGTGNGWRTRVTTKVAITQRILLSKELSRRCSLRGRMATGNDKKHMQHYHCGVYGIKL